MYVGPTGRPLVVALQSFGGYGVSYDLDMPAFELPAGRTEWLRCRFVRYAGLSESTDAGFDAIEGLPDIPVPTSEIEDPIPETRATLMAWLDEHGTVYPKRAKLATLKRLYGETVIAEVLGPS